MLLGSYVPGKALLERNLWRINFKLQGPEFNLKGRRPGLKEVWALERDGVGLKFSQ